MYQTYTPIVYDKLFIYCFVIWVFQNETNSEKKMIPSLVLPANSNTGPPYLAAPFLTAGPRWLTNKPISKWIEQ